MFLCFFAACKIDKLHEELETYETNCSIVADFEIINNNCKAPCEISFVNNSSDATYFSWDFGDGNTSTAGSPNKIFEKPGEYDVILVVSDGSCIDSLKKRVSVRWLTFEKTFGGSETDSGESIIQTQDGGFVIAGTTESYGAGSDDVYLILTDEQGNELSSSGKTYGESGSDIGKCIIQTQSGGFAITGRTSSYGVSFCDVYLILTDENGNEILSSNKAFGGTAWDEGRSIIQTRNGGFALIGDTGSYGSGIFDVYLILTDSGGNELAFSGKSYGGAGYEQGHSIIQTQDGSFAIIGQTDSYGNGSADVYLILTDESGNELPSSGKTYGGEDWDGGRSIIQTQNGGFAIIGGTSSFGNGSSDVYLILTDENGNELPSSGKTYGGAGINKGYAIIQTSDGGFAITGSIAIPQELSTDILFIKTDDQGNIE